MTKRNTQFPQDATVLDEPDRTDEDAAPPEPLAEADDAPTPPDLRTESPAVSESAPPVPDPPPPALLDLPVASVPPPVAPLAPPPADGAPLEARIQRLETQLAQLRSAQAQTLPVAAFHTASGDPSATVARQPGRFWADLGQRLAAPSAPSTSPPRTERLASMVPPGVRRSWLLWDAVTELRAMYWMFFDPRYRLSWTARLGPVVLLALILTSGFWLPLSGLYYIGFVIEKIADVVLAFLLFKLLSHESRRYRETAPDLPASLRL